MEQENGNTATKTMSSSTRARAVENCESGHKNKEHVKTDQQKQTKSPESSAINNMNSECMEMSPWALVTPQRLFTSNYQQLVQQTMERSTRCQGENTIPVVAKESFENNYQHLVTNVLTLDKAAKTSREEMHNTSGNMICYKELENKIQKHSLPLNRNTSEMLRKCASQEYEDLASMFRHGFDDADCMATSNDRSHILQWFNLGPCRSVAEFFRYGPDGPPNAPI